MSITPVSRLLRPRGYVLTRLNAIQQIRAEKRVRRMIQLLVGLIGYGTAVSVLVRSGLGASSWNVLSEGVAARAGISFGWATNLTALLVMVFWIPLRELPGLGTVLNVVLVGAAADAAASVLPPPHGLASQAISFTIGLVLLAFFDAVYIGARFGSGPRDGLMTGAVRVTRRPVWAVRMIIEAMVVTLGWALGGTVGLGTLIIALAMGPLVHFFLGYTTVPLRIDASAADKATGPTRKKGNQ